LILASGSPQRKAILEQLGVEFRVEVPEVEEVVDGVEPHELVRENALLKARAVRGHTVLGADTAVVLDDQIFGKPADEHAAERFLRALSGKTHEVMTGIAVIDHGAECSDVAVTQVTFRELGDADLDWYLATGEWRDRAGAYAIQGKGAALVDSIQGDYWNVVGLPVPALLRLMPDLLRG
jgi:nucleoside triphosphate pyrophosphatase